MFKDRRAAELLMSICALDKDDPRIIEEKIKAKVRGEIIEDLPVILQVIAAYWRDPDRPLPRSNLSGPQRLAKRPLPLRIRQEVQKVLRQRFVADPTLTRSNCANGRNRRYQSR